MPLNIMNNILKEKSNNMFCLLGIFCKMASSSEPYNFNFEKHQYYMIGKELGDGIDLIELNKEMIDYFNDECLEEDYPIIQVIAINNQSEKLNELNNVPDVLLRPKIFYGIKSENSTNTFDLFKLRYSILPF